MKVILATDSLVRPLTGIGNYTLALAEALQSSSEVTQLFYATADSVSSDLVINEPSRPRWRHSLIKRLLPHRLRRFRDLKAKKLSQSLPADCVFHATNYSMPAYDGATVVTIHDLSVIDHAGWHPSDRVMFLTAAIHKAVEEANILMFDSEFVLNLAVEKFPEAVSKMRVVPLPSRLPSPDKHDVKRSRSRFILGLVGDNPRKNTSALLRAYHMLPREVRQEYPLVLTGQSSLTKPDRQYLTDEVTMLGFVSEEELLSLYRKATFSVFPSVYEGFGLPIVESLSQGTPVLVHDYAGTREFDLPGLSFCCTLDCQSFSKALLTMLDTAETEDRERIISAVRDNYGLEPWLEKTLACYREAIHKHI